MKKKKKNETRNKCHEILKIHVYISEMIISCFYAVPQPFEESLLVQKQASFRDVAGDARSEQRKKQEHDHDGNRN